MTKALIVSAVLLAMTSACAAENIPIPLTRPGDTPASQIQQLQHQLRVDEAIIQQLQQQNSNQALLLTRLLAEQNVAQQDQKK